jgi:hypothetical protein
MTEIAQAAERFLHLFEGPPPVAFLAQTLLEEQSHVSVRNPDGRSKLMR